MSHISAHILHGCLSLFFSNPTSRTWYVTLGKKLTLPKFIIGQLKIKLNIN